MTQKVKVTQDILYQYLTEHGVKMVRLAELMKTSEANISSCFKHHKKLDGSLRSFTPRNIRNLNAALEQFSIDLRGCLLTFGSTQVYMNQRKKTYDPALVEPMKRIGELLNLTALVERVLGWDKQKKDNVLVTKTSKVYGTISKDDSDRINSELLSVAKMLSSFEIVPGNIDSSSLDEAGATSLHSLEEPQIDESLDKEYDMIKEEKMSPTNILQKLENIENELREVREYLTQSMVNSPSDAPVAVRHKFKLEYTLEDLYRGFGGKVSLVRRLKSALQKRDINTLEEFLLLTPGELLDLENVGYDTLLRTKKALNKLGIAW